MRITKETIKTNAEGLLNNISNQKSNKNLRRALRRCVRNPDKLSMKQLALLLDLNIASSDSAQDPNVFRQQLNAYVWQINPKKMLKLAKKAPSLVWQCVEKLDPADREIALAYINNKPKITRYWLSDLNTRSHIETQLRNLIGPQANKITQTHKIDAADNTTTASLLTSNRYFVKQVFQQHERFPTLRANNRANAQGDSRAVNTTSKLFNILDNDSVSLNKDGLKDYLAWSGGLRVKIKFILRRLLGGRHWILPPKDKEGTLKAKLLGRINRIMDNHGTLGESEKGESVFLGAEQDTAGSNASEYQCSMEPLSSILPGQDGGEIKVIISGFAEDLNASDAVVDNPVMKLAGESKMPVYQDQWCSQSSSRGNESNMREGVTPEKKEKEGISMALATAKDFNSPTFIQGAMYVGFRHLQSFTFQNRFVNKIYQNGVFLAARLLARDSAAKAVNRPTVKLTSTSSSSAVISQKLQPRRLTAPEDNDDSNSDSSNIAVSEEDNQQASLQNELEYLSSPFSSSSSFEIDCDSLTLTGLESPTASEHSASANNSLDLLSSPSNSSASPYGSSLDGLMSPLSSVEDEFNNSVSLDSLSSPEINSNSSSPLDQLSSPRIKEIDLDETDESEIYDLDSPISDDHNSNDREELQGPRPQPGSYKVFETPPKAGGRRERRQRYQQQQWRENKSSSTQKMFFGSHNNTQGDNNAHEKRFKPLADCNGEKKWSALSIKDHVAKHGATIAMVFDGEENTRITEAYVGDASKRLVEGLISNPELMNLLKDVPCTITTQKGNRAEDFSDAQAANTRGTEFVCT